ncbi:MAG: nucleotidyl transferase AbiEii/AbiGii toxin family protein [Thermoplasmatota archaeon]
MMVRIILTAEEKRATRGILARTWGPEALTQGAIQRASEPFGVNPREAYMTLLHLDTLDALRSLDFIVLKGGTCAQTYVAPDLQRVSIDLDFNSRHSHPKTVEAAVADLNVRLMNESRAATAQGIPFGTLVPDKVDAHTGTVGFARYLPSPFDDTVVIGGQEVQGRKLLVQINVKHHELPAIDARRREIAFFTQSQLRPRKPVLFECASPADLAADKILAITKNVGGFGRERIKDFYDLFVLNRLDVPPETVVAKLDRVAVKARTTREAILSGASERCEDVRANQSAVAGFIPTACNGGKAFLRNWELELDRLQGVLKALKRVG